MGGVWHTPHLLISATKAEKPHEWALNPDNVKKVVSGMYGVVNEGGTGVRARIPGVDVCGKTGTAQVASAEYEKTHHGIKDNAWFVGFAPCINPEIVVAVLWENVGVQGAHAAPTVRDIMVSYFDKKIRVAEAEAAKQKTNPTLANKSAALVSAIAPPALKN
jgi:penicillin-binding protein 2